MKNKVLGVLMALVIGLAGLAHAAVEVKNNGTVVGKAETINFTTGLTATASGTDMVLVRDTIQTTGINWPDNAGISSYCINWDNFKAAAAAYNVNWADITGL